METPLFICHYLFVFIHYRNKLFSLFVNINIITSPLAWRHQDRGGAACVAVCMVTLVTIKQTTYHIQSCAICMLHVASCYASTACIYKHTMVDSQSDSHINTPIYAKFFHVYCSGLVRFPDLGFVCWVTWPTRKVNNFSCNWSQTCTIAVFLHFYFLKAICHHFLSV